MTQPLSDLQSQFANEDRKVLQFFTKLHAVLISGEHLQPRQAKILGDAAASVIVTSLQQRKDADPRELRNIYNAEPFLDLARQLSPANETVKLAACHFLMNFGFRFNSRPLMEHLMPIVDCLLTRNYRN